MPEEQRTWSWTGKSRRHTIAFTHNPLSGAQCLTVDGEVIHRVSWKYKLTGCLFFNLDDSLVELHVRCDDLGSLDYQLTVDCKLVTVEDKRAVSTWIVSLPDGIHQIEFEHGSFDILLDGFKVEATGDFLDEGSCYHFSLPVAAEGAPATITVLPSADRRTKRLRTTLVVNEVEIPQSELLGEEESDAAASGSGDSSKSSMGRLELHVKRRGSGATGAGASASPVR